ncbi:hypothetical protein CSUI_008415, partial [Cystoisospora suis]
LFGEGDEGPNAKLPELPCFRLQRRRDDKENLTKINVSSDESPRPRHLASYGEKEETGASVERADPSTSGGVGSG